MSKQWCPLAVDTPVLPRRLTRSGWLLTAVILALLTPTGVQAQAAPEDGQFHSIEVPEEFETILRNYERGWAARDPEALAQLFTPNGFVLRPRHKPARGREAIVQSYTGVGGPLSLRPYAFEQGDSLGYMIGGWASRTGETAVGKWVLILRKDNTGKWLIASDMDNYDS